MGNKYCQRANNKNMQLLVDQQFNICNLKMMGKNNYYKFKALITY